MSTPSSDVAFTPTVKAIQERLGSRKSYSKLEASGGWSGFSSRAPVPADLPRLGDRARTAPASRRGERDS